MRTFLTLFKHERRALFPTLNLKRKPDIIGGLFSLLISALVVGIFLFMISTVAKNYVVLAINKQSAPEARSAELITVLYSVAIVAITFLCLEKMRKTLALKTGKDIFLRLPVSAKTIFMSKLSALTLWNFVTSAVFILPINAIFYFILEPGVEFWIGTALVVVFLPTVSFLLATLLLVPYILTVNFFSRHYFMTFVLFSALIIGAFLLYSEFLNVMREMLETGSIKFLFNQRFVDTLQKTQKLAYPANLLAYMLLGEKMALSVGVLSGIAVVSIVTAVLITNALYKITMYSTSQEKVRRGKRHVMKLPPMLALMRKEFISVFRNPKYLFSYFSIAIAMPFMVHCSYVLFETLLIGAIARSFELALALMVILVFSILTNTFCATNFTRDGISALKAKIFPMSPSKILISKILFCNIVSSLSVIASGAFLWLKAGISAQTVVIATSVGLIISFANILISTRMDLNHARVASSPAEAEKASNRTIAKTISVGLLFALVISFTSLFASALSDVSLPFLGGFVIKNSYSFLFPLVISALYLLISVVYCFRKVDKAFAKLVR